ncbi:ABC transporter ATP-binding protein [Lactiplantibacillus pentosus]|uniref:ABC transporter ATP-binding protein n=1 Tax=Lactiplantibacillus pentosus TaxID=1589 RepID=UPI003D7A37A2
MIHDKLTSTIRLTNFINLEELSILVAIKLQHVSKSYQGPVIEDLNLTIPTQQITALVGPSGSGKSTLLNLIAGLTTPDSGQIWFDEQPIFDADQSLNCPPAKRQLAMVFQDFALWPHMTVHQNIAFAIETHLSKAECRKRVEWALAQVSLADYGQRYPRELSGGQQQRVALARALATQPDLILFDEALSALDPQLRLQLQQDISALVKAHHLTAIFVTHDRQEALRIADNIVLLHAGRVVQSDTAANLYQYPRNQFAARFMGPLNQIDDHTAVRPEHVHLVEQGADGPCYPGQILTSTFMGDHYDTLVQMADYQWHLKTALPYAPATITMTVDSSAILTY